MHEDPIDFSALDPKRDPAHFESMVRTVVAGVPQPAATSAVLRGFLRWGRPALACAALLAISAWIPTLRQHWQNPGASADALALVSSWADEGAIPPAADVFQALEDLNGQ